MDKKQIALLNQQQVKRCTAIADSVKSFKGHKRTLRVVSNASTTNYRGRKRYADGYQTSANEKIDVAQTPIGVRVSTTTKIGPVSMTTTRWASKNRGSNK